MLQPAPPIPNPADYASEDRSAVQYTHVMNNVVQNSLMKVLNESCSLQEQVKEESADMSLTQIQHIMVDRCDVRLQRQSDLAKYERILNDHQRLSMNETTIQKLR